MWWAYFWRRDGSLDRVGGKTVWRALIEAAKESGTGNHVAIRHPNGTLIGDISTNMHMDIMAVDARWIRE